MSETSEHVHKPRYGCIASVIILFFVACVVFVTLFGVGLINCGGEAPTRQ